MVVTGSSIVSDWLRIVGLNLIFLSENLGISPGKSRKTSRARQRAFIRKSKYFFYNAQLPNNSKHEFGIFFLISNTVSFMKFFI